MFSPLRKRGTTPKRTFDSEELKKLQTQDWVSALVRRDTRARATTLEVEKQVTKSPDKEKASYLANLLLQLNVDTPVVLAGALFYADRGSEEELAEFEEASVLKLVTALDRMAQADDVAETSAPFLDRQSRDHRKNVRHMLIALIDDPRVAVLKLSERLVAMEFAKQLEERYRKKVAKEVMEFYCPLASRLGVWQLKWMLEDLAFAYLHPDDYREIVAGFKDRRVEREKQVEAVCEDLQWRLSRQGLKTEVSGRAKNVYGIWRKMSEKKISFDTVYDAEAVRVVVNEVSECYSVLGVVHTSWPAISEAFDDYIANPKANGYRSLHTAVVGPRGRNLEVQIRTHKMHEEAEFGVCAHWAYKDEDEAFKMGKIDWMREVLHWQDEMYSENLFIDVTRRLEAPERIYISTPKGHVIDLPAGSTAVDFAYRIHTDIGNHCCGVKVNGHQKPLNQPLETGQVVEVLTSPRATPQRQWLDEELGYVRTSRVRKSIQNYFREELAETNAREGKAWLDEECQRMKIEVDMDSLAHAFNYSNVEEMYIAVAVGDQPVRELLPMRLASPAETDTEVVQPEPDKPERIVEELAVYATDRPQLLLDITFALAAMSINVVGAHIHAPVPGEPALLRLKVEVDGLESMRNVINRLRAVPDVVDVKRHDEETPAE